MADGKVARIDTIQPEARAKIVNELEERCEAHAKGKGENVLTIREGIHDQAVQEGIHRATPANFGVLL